MLRFPHTKDAFGMEQARTHVRILEEWLTGALVREVRVEPVLVLPGWSVVRTGAGETAAVKVWNQGEVGARVGDAVKSALRAGRAPMPETLRRQARLRLDQQCRRRVP